MINEQLIFLLKLRIGTKNGVLGVHGRIVMSSMNTVINGQMTNVKEEQQDKEIYLKLYPIIPKAVWSSHVGVKFYH